MITATVIGGKELTARLSEITPRLKIRLRFDMTKFLIYLQTYIKKEKLSAPEGYSPDKLHHRTGNLMRAIHWALEESEGVVGKMTVGNEAPYGKLHEYGGVVNRVSKTGKVFTQTYPMRSFMRQSLADNVFKFNEMVNKAVKDTLGAR